MTKPIRVALINDYEVVVLGFNQLFAHYADRIEVVTLVANEPVRAKVDIALYDSFGQGEPYADSVPCLLENAAADKTVVYTWNMDEDLIAWCKANGVAACLSKEMPAAALVEALEAVHSGKRVFPAPMTVQVASGAAWPGREEGLSYREGEMIALLVRGLTNAEIAALLFLSPNSVKSYIRSAYRKIGVARRSQAVPWGW